MFNALKDYLLLPQEVTSFEDDYLKRTNRVASVFLMAHLPFMVVLAYCNDTSPALAALLTTGVLLGPIMACRSFKSRRAVSMVHGVASMMMGGLLVHFGQGPVQIEMHFYFFVLLALLAVFANPLVIVAAAGTAALHHALLWWILPDSVFNYDAPFWVVGVHAAFVVLESIAACFIARSFFDNVIGLEKIVEARTAEVAARNRDILTILNSVEEGFLTIDRAGEIESERSAAVETLLGPLESKDSFTTVLARHDAQIAEWFEFGLEEVFEGMLPVEVTIDQLPDKIVAHERSLAIRYFPVKEEDDLKKLTVVVADITAEVERQKLEAESRELLIMLDRISNDRHGFLEFFQDAEQAFDAFRTEAEQEELDSVLLKRRLHTLKGNSSVFGLHRLADACHRVEDHFAEFGLDYNCEAWTNLFSCWATVRGNLRRLISDNTNEHRLTDEQYSELLLGLLNRVPIESLAPKVAAWKLDPVEQRLKRIAAQAKQLANRMGKGEIEVDIESNGLRTEAKSWSGFWASLVHVVRNAVDHGLESSEDRSLASKHESGRLKVSATCGDGKFVVAVADNGKGVDWDRVKVLAEERGLPTSSHEDLVNAIFADGFTTRTQVTETSGRGVGMAALKHQCNELGGEIEVQSVCGQGTEFRFIFPVEAMAPKLYGLLVSHGIEPDLVAMVAA